MRILSVGNMYPPHHFGGYELVWQGVMRRAREQGHDVRIVVSDYRRGDVEDEDEDDVRRTLRWYWSWDDFRWAELSAWQRWRLERANAIELKRHLSEFSPDVVSWWSMGGMSLSLIEQVHRRGIPAVFGVHDDWLVYGPDADAWARLARRTGVAAGMLEHVARVPMQWDLANAGRFLFNSVYTQRRAADSGILPAQTAVITPGIDERFLTDIPPAPWRWRMCYVGRIDRQKGIDTAIASLAHLPETATLTVIGAGDAGYLTELRKQAKGLGAGERVRFLGQQAPESLPSIYAAADVLVFPVRWREPWGLVPLEAMGLGRLVVATGTGGSAEFMRDGDNALLFAPNDARALARAVSRLSASPDLRDRLRKAGLRTAAEHSAAEFDRKFLVELEQAALSGSSRLP